MSPKLRVLMSKSNVVSVGMGFKTINGIRTDILCCVVGVIRKLPPDQLSNAEIIPTSVDGIGTDVIETGEIKALQSNPKDKHRPAMPGVSIGHHQITAGTFGCVVKHDGRRHILSNNHVMANSNNADIGDNIYQPGPTDGGVDTDTIAKLTNFVPIKFGSSTPSCPIARGTASLFNKTSQTLNRKHRLEAKVNIESADNLIDAAIALPINDDDIIDDISGGIGIPNMVLPTSDINIGMPVQKFGRTTNYTTGEILQLDAIVRVSYGSGKIATFVNQLVTGPMSAGGDSGSAVLDMNNNLVGLLFAGSDQTTIMNPMTEVFNLLVLSL
jgi:hypothetical protein